MKAWTISLMTALASLMLTGCWDSTEIDRLAIVTMSGVDLAPDGKKILGSAQIAKASELGTSGGGAPSTSTGSKKAYIVESSIANDAVATIEEMRSQLSRKMFLGHRRVIVLGEDFAKNGVNNLLDEIVRNPRSRLRTYIVVAYHNQALNVLNTPYPLNRLPSDAIVDLEQSGSVLDIDARRFMKKLSENGDPVATGVEILPSAEEGDGQSSATFALENIALFQRDKLVGWLDGRSAHGFLWLDGSLKQEDSTVAPAGQTKTISAHLGTANVHRSVRMVNGKPMFQVDVKAQYDVDQNSTDLDLSDPKNINFVRDALAKEMTSQMKAAMTELQQTYHTDSLGFGEIMEKRYPREWARLKPRWRDLYSTTPVEYKVKIRVRNSGLISSSIYKEESTGDEPGGQ